MKTDLAVKLLLSTIAVLLALNLLTHAIPEARADRDEGPVGTYQISSYTVPPTDTRPNYVRGYYLVDTRTGDVESEEDTVW